ncbi:hypothetical protein [uncultured Hymenobacter sp.]|uniref:hypothetical protein n=1 Tax=uncultured Hymenobacter sp. TaxID=170016 RepID=UPI0035CA7B08
MAIVSAEIRWQKQKVELAETQSFPLVAFLGPLLEDKFPRALTYRLRGAAAKPRLLNWLAQCFVTPRNTWPLAVWKKLLVALKQPFC